MTTFNKVILVGHLVADPEVRETQKGDTVATFRMATDRYSGVKEQDPNQVTADFHSVVAWDKLAEVVRDYLKKGMAVYVEGRLHNRSYELLPNETRQFVTEVRLEMLNILSCVGAADWHTNQAVPGSKVAHEGTECAVVCSVRE